MEQQFIGFARDFFCSELTQMRCNKLGVEQAEMSLLESCDEMTQSHFAGVGRGGKHTFAEKRCSEGNTIKTTDKHTIARAFDTMGIAFVMQLNMQVDNLRY